MKKHCEVKHFDILKMHVNEIVQQHSVEIDLVRKQSSKLQKVVFQDPFLQFLVILQHIKIK
jgi:hypothetical protein